MAREAKGAERETTASGRINWEYALFTENVLWGAIFVPTLTFFNSFVDFFKSTKAYSTIFQKS